MADVDTALFTARDWEVPPAAGDEAYRAAFVSIRIADVLAKLVIGDRLYRLPLPDKQWLMALGERAVNEALVHYAAVPPGEPDAPR